MRTYPINEIFYSLQGEGYFTGTPAIFIRFSGCNLSCPFCDTDHRKAESMSVDDIMLAISAFPAVHVVLTGGEPALYVDEMLLEHLHQAGKFVAIETNGTRMLPNGIDWVTLSPKDNVAPQSHTVLTACDELKVVYMGADSLPDLNHIKVRHYFLQPCDTGDKDSSALLLSEAVEFCKSHPRWRLSLQTHKMIDIK